MVSLFSVEDRSDLVAVGGGGVSYDSFSKDADGQRKMHRRITIATAAFTGRLRPNHCSNDLFLLLTQTVFITTKKR